MILDEIRVLQDLSFVENNTEQGDAYLCSCGHKFNIENSKVIADMVKHEDNVALKLTDIEAKTATQQDANFQQNLNIIARFDPMTGEFY